jgi:hypothetical protein
VKKRLTDLWGRGESERERERAREREGERKRGAQVVGLLASHSITT